MIVQIILKYIQLALIEATCYVRVSLRGYILVHCTRSWKLAKIQKNIFNKLNKTEEISYEN